MTKNVKSKYPNALSASGSHWVFNTEQKIKSTATVLKMLKVKIPKWAIESFCLINSIGQ